MNLKLYKYEVDFGRAGQLSGMFITTPEVVNDAYGKRAYYGEVLGKHSEVWADVLVGQIEEFPEWLVKIDQAAAQAVMDETGASWLTLTGYNPLDYIEGE